MSELLKVTQLSETMTQKRKVIPLRESRQLVCLSKSPSALRACVQRHQSKPPRHPHGNVFIFQMQKPDLRCEDSSRFLEGNYTENSPHTLFVPLFSTSANRNAGKYRMIVVNFNFDSTSLFKAKEFHELKFLGRRFIYSWIGNSKKDFFFTRFF